MATMAKFVTVVHEVVAGRESTEKLQVSNYGAVYLHHKIIKEAKND